MRTRITLLAASVLTLAACQGTRSESAPIHLNPNMDFQDKYEAQERNDHYADGRAMRPPVEGTVARGLLKDDDHLWRGRGIDGRLVDALPGQLELNEDLLERGEARFNIFCAPCHDESGRGQGVVTKRGGRFQVQPASFHQARLRAMPLGYLYKVIAEGQGTMLSYAAQIPVEDRWAIAVWARALQKHGEAKGWDDDTVTQVAAAGGEK
jgi:mono/diheme cytochrome c family protein